MATRYSRRTRLGHIEHYDTQAEMDASISNEFDARMTEDSATFALYAALAVGIVASLAFFHFIGDAILAHVSSPMRLTTWVGGTIGAVWLTHRLFRRRPDVVVLASAGLVAILVLGGVGFVFFR